MDIGEWQRRIGENFTIDGLIGGHLCEIIGKEKEYGVFFAETFHGQSALIDSFQSFYVETIRSTERWINENCWPKNSTNYVPVYLYYITNFKSFRACENLLLRGYPLDGYALLRDLKDRAIFLGAIAKNVTTLPRIYGYETIKEASEEAWKRSRKEREREQKKVLSKMIRQNSGLPENTRILLQKWEQLFNEEVHGSRLTFMSEFDDLIKGKGPVSIGPTPKINPMAMYMNRASEIGWLFTRLLPFLQPVKMAFGESWATRQKILDDSFRFMVEGLSKLGKDFIEAFIYFVDSNFCFYDTLYYSEADGSS